MQRIHFTTAKLAKEKKFDWPVDRYYTFYKKTRRDKEYPNFDGGHGYKKNTLEEETGYFRNFSTSDFSGKAYDMYARSTQSHLQQWLRDVCYVFIDIETDATREPKFCYTIHQYFPNGEWKHSPSRSDLFYTYESALETALQEALNKWV